MPVIDLKSYAESATDYVTNLTDAFTNHNIYQMKLVLNKLEPLQTPF